jgi:hypothetical protein
LNAVDGPAHPQSPHAAWRRLVLTHAWLAVSMVVWRVIEGMPRTASVAGGEFAASPTGRALALVTILGGVTALVVLIGQTFRLRRDARALVLFAALIGALWSRKTYDVFDVTWLALVAIAAALAFSTGFSADRAPSAPR